MRFIGVSSSSGLGSTTYFPLHRAGGQPRQEDDPFDDHNVLYCTVLYCTVLLTVLCCTVLYCTWSVPWYWQWACLPVLPHPLPPLLPARPPPEYWWV